MYFLERDLEDILFNSQKEEVVKRGLYSFNHDLIFRQVRISGYGIIDLLTISFHRKSKGIIITVYELKNKKLGSETFWQLLRYIKAIKHVLATVNLKNHYVNISGVMIGREIDLSNDFCYLPTLQSEIDIFTYDYNLDGMKFFPVRDSYFHNGYNHDFNIKQLGSGNYKEFIRKMINSEVINTPQEVWQELEA